MGCRTRFLSSIAAAAFIAVSLSASVEEPPLPTLALLVYNYAGVQVDTMQQASKKVMRTYREAGVDIVWIEPLADARHTMINPTSNSLHMFTVQTMIRPHKPSERASTPEAVMGTATAADGNGGTLSLYYDQVLRAAHKYHQPIEDLLALALAHEMGHLLLPPPAHSNNGIMRAEWAGDDIRHAIVGSLSFTSTEAALIRSKVDGCCLHAAK